MSGKDKLTDAELHPLTMIDGSVGAMARELLAHRRASQASPAPSDGLREENERLRVAVEFYANPSNWIDTPDWDGPDTATPKAVPVMNDPLGSRPCDCGDTARAALSAPAQRGNPAMTDPTRAEVEALEQRLRESPFFNSSQYVRQAADMIQALRERAEAAEFERDFWHGALATANSQCYEARRAEAAAWNDAIEAVLGLQRHSLNFCDRMEVTTDGAWLHRDDIRALRRPAPTEGEA